MNNILRGVLLASTLLTAEFFVTPARASLIGDEVTATWTVMRNGFIDVNTFVASDGIDLLGDWALGHNLDVLDSAIEVDFPFATGLGPGVLWEFTSLDWVGMDGSIANVTVDTNYVGWSDSFLSFGPNSISIDFSNRVQFPQSDLFRINITAEHVSALPEPSSLSLLLIGLAGTILVRLRKII